MTVEVEKIETITVDGAVYQVEDLSAEIQNLVAIYSQWRADAEQARLDHLKVNAALRELSREIGQAVRTANAAKEEAANAEVTTAEVAAEPAGDPAVEEDANAVGAGDVASE